jgi:hypothetical protein
MLLASGPEHATRRRTNGGSWSMKLARNAERDARNNAALRASGWRVLRIWEHEPVDRAVDLVHRELAGLPATHGCVAVGFLPLNLLAKRCVFLKRPSIGRKRSEIVGRERPRPSMPHSRTRLARRCSGTTTESRHCKLSSRGGAAASRSRTAARRGKAIRGCSQGSPGDRFDFPGLDHPLEDALHGVLRPDSREFANDRVGYLHVRRKIFEDHLLRRREPLMPNLDDHRMIGFVRKG